MSDTEEIFVKLMDEAVDVWRPVKAERVRDNVYRIVDQTYASQLETWQFVAGDEVICEMIEGNEGRFRAATGRTLEP